MLPEVQSRLVLNTCSSLRAATVLLHGRRSSSLLWVVFVLLNEQDPLHASNTGQRIRGGDGNETSGCVDLEMQGWAALDMAEMGVDGDGAVLVVEEELQRGRRCSWIRAFQGVPLMLRSRLSTLVY